MRPCKSITSKNKRDSAARWCMRLRSKQTQMLLELRTIVFLRLLLLFLRRRSARPSTTLQRAVTGETKSWLMFCRSLPPPPGPRHAAHASRVAVLLPPIAGNEVELSHHLRAWPLPARDADGSSPARGRAYAYIRLVIANQLWAYASAPQSPLCPSRPAGQDLSFKKKGTLGAIPPLFIHSETPSCLICSVPVSEETLPPCVPGMWLHSHALHFAFSHPRLVLPQVAKPPRTTKESAVSSAEMYLAVLPRSVFNTYNPAAAAVNAMS